MADAQKWPKDKPVPPGWKRGTSLFSRWLIFRDPYYQPPTTTEPPKHSENTTKEGEVLALAYGLPRVAGNVIRVNDGNASDLRMLVGHCRGEIDSILATYINDIYWNAIEGAKAATHWKSAYTGTFTQTKAQKAGQDVFGSRDCAYRGLAYSAFVLDKTYKPARGTPKISVIMRGKKCIPIGGGATAWTRDPAVVLYDFRRNVMGDTDATLDANAFNSLSALCSAYPTSGTGSPMRPPGPSSDTVKATSTFAFNNSPWFAVDADAPITGDANRGCWASLNGNRTNQRFNVDLGVPVILTKITLVNFHISGGSTTPGINSFAIQGSNSSTAFANTDYATDTNWTNLQTGLTASAYSSSAPEQDYSITAPGTTAYRYFSLKIASNLGASYMGFRSVLFWGRHPRYTFDRLFDKNVTASEMQKEICRAFFGSAIRSQGKTKPVFDWSQEADGAGSLANKTVRYAFTMHNIEQGSFSWWKPERPNKVTVKYLNASRHYAEDSIVLRDDGDISLRGEVPFEETCWWIIAQDQARARAQLILNRARYDDYHCKLTAFTGAVKLEICDLVTVTHTSPGWTAKQFTVISKEEDFYGVSEFELRAYHAGVYSDAGVPIQDNYRSNLPTPYEVPSHVTGIASTDVSLWDEAGHYQQRTKITYTRPANQTFWDHADAYYAVSNAVWAKDAAWAGQAVWGAQGTGGFTKYPAPDPTGGDGMILGGDILGSPVDGAATVKVLSVSTSGTVAELETAPAINCAFYAPNLETAIAALPPEGGRLLLPEGVYQLTGALNFPDKNIEIMGVNRDRVIIRNKAGENGFVLHNLTRTFKFSDFKIESQNTSVYSYMIYVYGDTTGDNISDTLFNNISLSLKDDGSPASTGDNGIYLYKGLGKTTINNCKSYNGLNGFYAAYYSNVLISSTRCDNTKYIGIYTYDVDYFSIQSNILTDQNVHGIRCDNTSIEGSASNNIIIGSNRSGNSIIDISGIYFTADNISATSNVISITNTLTTAKSFGFWLVTSNRNNILNNTITINSQTDDNISGIYINGGNDNVISENNIQYNNNGDNTSSHVGIWLYATADRNNISGNYIDGVNNNAKDYGISLETGCDNNLVSGNFYYRVGVAGADNGTGNTFQGNKDV